MTADEVVEAHFPDKDRVSESAKKILTRLELMAGNAAGPCMSSDWAFVELIKAFFGCEISDLSAMIHSDPMRVAELAVDDPAFERVWATFCSDHQRKERGDFVEIPSIHVRLAGRA